MAARAIERLRKWLIYFFLVTGAVTASVPFLWMLLSSFMTQGETIRRVFAPQNIQWSNYQAAWSEANFGLYFTNSILVAIIQILGTLTFSLLAAYPLARMEFRGRDIIFSVILATMMVPEAVTMVPNFLTITWLHRSTPFDWLNNWPSLTLPFLVSGFSIFLLRQFMRGVPNDLWDAARIDGAGHIRFLFRIIVPLCRAPLLTVGMFTFIGSWNSLAWPLLVTNTPNWRPLSVGLQQFVSEAGAEVHLQMAGAVIATLPVLIAYFLIQKEFTEGISMSGLKG